MQDIYPSEKSFPDYILVFSMMLKPMNSRNKAYLNSVMNFIMIWAGFH